MPIPEAEQRPVTLIKPHYDREFPDVSSAVLIFSGRASDELGWGSESLVNRVTMPVAGEIFPGLAYKECLEEENAIDAVEKLMYLERAGAPVPSDYYLVKDGKRYAGVLMTDLTRGWNDILITSNDTKEYVVANVMGVNPTTVRRFAAFDLQNPEFQRKFNAQLIDSAARTAQAGIKFEGRDVLSAIFTHEGNLVPIISDARGIKVNQPTQDPTFFQHNYREARGIRLFISSAQSMAKSMVRG